MAPWKKALNISDSCYQEFKTQAKGSEPLVFWALKHKKIDLKQYMHWAMRAYSLPVLRESFLDNINLKREDIKTISAFNSYFAPVYTFEKKIFAVCVEPPLIKDSKILPLLARPEIIEKCWTRLQKTKSDEPGDAKAEPAEPAEPVESSPSQGLPTAITKITGLFGAEKKSTELEDVYADIFAKTKKYFSSSLVFRLKNQKFISVKWTQNIKQGQSEISISDTSIFRILVMSNTPYHGIIIKNDHHDQYFSAWGYKELPRHITLLPLHNESGQMMGAFLGIAENPVHRKYLNTIIDIVKPLKNVLSPKDSSQEKPVKAS